MLREIKKIKANKLTERGRKSVDGILEMAMELTEAASERTARHD